MGVAMGMTFAQISFYTRRMSAYTMQISCRVQTTVYQEQIAGYRPIAVYPLYISLFNEQDRPVISV